MMQITVALRELAIASLYTSEVEQWQPYSVPFVVEIEILTDQIHILIISALVLHFFQD